MTQACTICRHPDRAAIDRLLVADRASLRAIAGQFDVSKSAVDRHAEAHVPAALAKAQHAAEASLADDLLAQVKALRSKAVGLLLKAEQSGDIRTALMGVREARGCLELLAKLLGELDDRPTVNLLLAPEWAVVRAAIMEALGAHPGARTAVSARLLALESGNGRHG